MTGDAETIRAADDLHADRERILGVIRQAERDQRRLGDPLIGDWKPDAARAALDRLLARLEAVTQERDELHERWLGMRDCYDREVLRVGMAEEALARIADQQPKTLAMIERNGFVFDSIGREPGNWQHLAFTIYSNLCEVDVIARVALGEDLSTRAALAAAAPGETTEAE